MPLGPTQHPREMAAMAAWQWSKWLQWSNAGYQNCQHIKQLHPEAWGRSLAVVCNRISEYVIIDSVKVNEE